MRIVRNRFIPFKGFKAINLFGVVFMRRECGEMGETDLNHELIHSLQMRELWYLGFYILYFAEWLAGVLKGKSSDEAYFDISFEREAYRHEGDLKYCERRESFAQWKER